jgi:hypothetical protein
MSAGELTMSAPHPKRPNEIWPTNNAPALPACGIAFLANHAATTSSSGENIVVG